MNRFIAIIGAILCVNMTFAQSFHGEVTSASSNTPIANAIFSIVEIEVEFQSDSLGHFNYSNELPSHFTVRIYAHGYDAQLQKIENINQDFHFTLIEKHIALDEVTISGAKNTLQRNSAIHIETRKLSEMNTITTTTLGDALATIPGVYNSSTGVGISKPVIRGSQGIRVVSFLNGLRIENQQWGGDHGMGITELGIGSVEVIKGPNSLLFGADALGGVVYFKDEAFAKSNSHEITAKTQFESASLGTKNQLLYKMAKKNVRLSVGGLYTNNADYQLPSGQFAQNSRFNDKAAKLAFGMNKGSWSMNLRYNFSTTRAGIPGHTHDSIVNTADFQVDAQKRKNTVPAQVFFNHFLSLENKWFLKRNEVSVLLGQTFNRLTEYEDKLTIPGISADLFNTLYTVKLKTQLNEQFSLISGLQGMYQNNINSAKATEQLIPNATTMDNGAFVIAYFEKKGWNLQAGLRYDVRQVKSLETFKGTDPIQRLYQGLNYSVGAVKSFKEQTIRMNVSSGFRAPHLSELLANGFHHGALRYEIGSIDLKPEKANQLDLSYEYHGEHIEFVVNPFASLLTDFIYLSPLDTLISSLPVYEYKQLSKGYSYGTDVSWHWHPHFAHWLHLENSFSYVSIEGSEGFNVSLLPQSRISTLLKFEIPMKTKFRIESLSVQHQYSFEQNQVASYETASPSYQVFNIGLQGKLEGKTPLEIKIGVKNVLNTRYIDHLSRLKNIDLPFPGRNYYVSIVYQLMFNQK
jgi:iron complex outermembrane receptor protein